MSWVYPGFLLALALAITGRFPWLIKTKQVICTHSEHLRQSCNRLSP